MGDGAKEKGDGENGRKGEWENGRMGEEARHCSFFIVHFSLFIVHCSLFIVPFQSVRWLFGMQVQLRIHGFVQKRPASLFARSR